MGKAAKSLTFVSDKKTKLEIKKQQLQKVKKSGNSIKKLKDKSKDDQLKNDYEELKALLRLDVVANSTMSDIDSANQQSSKLQINKEVRQEIKKKLKMSTKKKRFIKLLESNPQRDKKPKDLTDIQIESAKKTLKDNSALTRGQKKRLKKKEKFINKKIMESKAVETKQINKKKLIELKNSLKPPKPLDDQMVDVSIVKKQKKQEQSNKFGDFSNMNSLLENIQSQVQKQEKQQQMQKQSKKQQAIDAQQEKERLSKIINLNSFHQNSLDTLFLHVNNTINQKNQNSK
ncbi:UNKNOWN [Stylonychia lemnae]|uniref:Uncharacterized protein n=1 Tax=Stylonychia lemnae TaxID=5949 RepID=A0A078AKN7_STYLE|nr:UNKNOWN [Stylonychia lemnae]|eukprot:CDW82774.1 UNKNOWN [Stylonychia lemnae]